MNVTTYDKRTNSTAASPMWVTNVIYCHICCCLSQVLLSVMACPACDISSCFLPPPPPPHLWLNNNSSEIQVRQTQVVVRTDPWKRYRTCNIWCCWWGRGHFHSCPHTVTQHDSKGSKGKWGEGRGYFKLALFYTCCLLPLVCDHTGRHLWTHFKHEDIVIRWGPSELASTEKHHIHTVAHALHKSSSSTHTHTHTRVRSTVRQSQCQTLYGNENKCNGCVPSYCV